MNRFRQCVSVMVSAGLLALAACSGVTDSNGPADASPSPAQRPFDPTVPRTPQPSKSLTLSPEWKPPSPTHTRPAQLRPRVQPAKHYGVENRSVGLHPSDADIRALTSFGEPLRAIPGGSTPAETDALAAALREEAHDDRRIEALQRFLGAHPQSRWAPALHLNAGAVSYQTGYFQDALDHWKSAWDLAKGGEDEVSKDIANLALAEYAKMNARIGRLSELESAIAEAQKRTLMGDARVKITNASEGVWI